MTAVGAISGIDVGVEHHAGLRTGHGPLVPIFAFHQHINVHPLTTATDLVDSIGDDNLAR